MKNHQSGFAPILILVLVVVLALGGYVWVKNRQGPKASTPPSSLPEGEGTNTSPLGGGREGVATDPTGGWKTYTNEKYGVTFKYPIDYDVYSRAENDQNVLSPASDNPRYLFLAKTGLINQSFTNAILHIEVNPTYFVSLDDFQSYLRQNYQADYDNGNIKSMPILSRVKTGAAGSGEDVMKLSNDNEQTSAYYLLERQTLIVIEPRFPTTDEANKIVGGVLSSFRFIPPNTQPSNVGWKTYKNDKYGFELKYPPTWSKSERPSVGGFLVIFQSPDFADQAANPPGTKDLGVRRVISGSKFTVYSNIMTANNIDSYKRRLAGIASPEPFDRISLADRPALSLTTSTYRSIETIFDDRHFGIFFEFPTENSVSHESFFNQIISTFRFLK